MTLRCLVVDDDDFSRTTVAAAIAGGQIEVVAVVGTASEAIGLDVANIDVAVLDLDLGEGPNGIDLAHGLRKLNPTIGIVLLTSFSDPRLFAASVKELPTSSAYVVKQSLKDIRILTTAIVASSEISQEQSESKVPRVPLSDSQVETLRLLAYGLSNSEIARVRVVTEKSVEQAVKRAATALDIEIDPTANQRVALARAFFSLTGATRHPHLHR
ncbi:MAG: response regulator [Actinomycetia bacterium]|nr:response regulator [Actinomycetes bacterium]